MNFSVKTRIENALFVLSDGYMFVGKKIKGLCVDEVFFNIPFGTSSVTLGVVGVAGGVYSYSIYQGKPKKLKNNSSLEILSYGTLYPDKPFSFYEMAKNFLFHSK